MFSKITLGLAGAAALLFTAFPVQAQLVATTESYGLVCHLIVPTAQRGANIQLSGESAAPVQGTPCQDPVSGGCGVVTDGLVSITAASATLSSPRFNAIFADDPRFKTRCSIVTLAGISPAANAPPQDHALPTATAPRPAPLDATLPTAAPALPASVRPPPVFACHFTSGPLASSTLEATSVPLTGPAGIGCTDGYGSTGTVVSRGLACQFTSGPMRGLTIVPNGFVLAGPTGQPCDDHYGNYGFQTVAPGTTAGS